MNISSIQDFIQEDPLIFDSPTFKTEVKLLYDQKNIYLYAKLYHDNPEDIAKYYLDRGVKNCVLTMGGEGSLFMNKENKIITPAFDIKVVDTTGCGDAFDAGMIVALIKEMDIETSLKFATITSGLVATGLGSDAGIINFDDCIDKMNSFKIKN